MRKWISLSEQLPEVGEYVLVLWGLPNHAKHDPGMAVLARRNIVSLEDSSKVIGYSWHDEEYGCSWNIDYASHWQPLPEPPKD